MAALWAQFRRKPDKCYCPCKKCKGLKNRRILITSAQSHCRQHGHVEGGHDFRPLLNVDFLLEEHGGVNIQAKLQKVGQHKLGSGGYMNLQSRLGTEFNVELIDEDRKIALKEGYKVVAARLREESESLAQESSAPNDISQPSYPITEPTRDEGHDVHYSGGEHVEHHGEGVEHVPSVQHVDVAADQNVNVHEVALSEPPLVQPPPAPPKRSHRNLTLHMPEEEENEGDMDAPMSAFLMRAKKNKKKK